jgi:hypothetical protein
VTTQHDLLEPQMIEHADHIRRVLGDRVALRRFVAQAAATQVEGDHAKARREARVDQAVEVVQVGGDPGQQHDRRLAAGVIGKMKANAVGRCVSIDHGLQLPADRSDVKDRRSSGGSSPDSIRGGARRSTESSRCRDPRAARRAASTRSAR